MREESVGGRGGGVRRPPRGIRVLVFMVVSSNGAGGLHPGSVIDRLLVTWLEHAATRWQSRAWPRGPLAVDVEGVVVGRGSAGPSTRTRPGSDELDLAVL